MRNYHLPSPTPRCAMKVDIMKAYNNVRWEFMLDVLKSMGFLERMIKWISACMTFPGYSLKCINGELNGFFQGAKGLRQGDPLSPYLFVMAMEVLSACLKKKSEDSDFKLSFPL